MSLSIGNPSCLSGARGEEGALVARDDQRLVDDCLRGDASAWDELIERYGRLVYSIPRRIGLSASDADDVFQIVFGIVLRKLDTLREVDRLPSWLIRTTYRECWRVARRRPQLAGDLPAEAESDEAAPPEEFERAERIHMVRQAIMGLDDRCRALLEALFFQKDTPDYEQIAEMLGMKVGSIGPTRARCFKKLESLLGKSGL
jgi:RNA polymerase sigma factor (sigma-70 family)